MPRAVILFVNRIVDFCRCRLVSDKNALLQVLLASASRSVCTLCLSVLPGRVVREYPLNKEQVTCRPLYASYSLCSLGSRRQF